MFLLIDNRILLQFKDSEIVNSFLFVISISNLGDINDRLSEEMTVFSLILIEIPIQYQMIITLSTNS